MKMIQRLILLFAMIASSMVYAGPININTADASALAAGIQGVGEKRAQAIVEYRNAHGEFVNVDALANVKGIGTSTIEKNRDNLTVGEQSLNQPAVAAE